MKKTIFIIILSALGTLLCAQPLSEPNEPNNGFAFPIGSEFTIKLHPTAPGKYDFSVINFEPFEGVVALWNNEYLFPKEGEDNTILIYFCYGTLGETQAEKDKTCASSSS